MITLEFHHELRVTRREIFFFLTNYYNIFLLKKSWDHKKMIFAPKRSTAVVANVIQYALYQSFSLHYPRHKGVGQDEQFVISKISREITYSVPPRLRLDSSRARRGSNGCLGKDGLFVMHSHTIPTVQIFTQLKHFPFSI